MHAKPINPSYLALALCTLQILTIGSNASAQERWFKIELSIFSNESTTDRNEERWVAERSNLNLAANTQRLKELSDLLLLPSMIPPEPEDTEGLIDGAPSSTDEDLILEVSPDRETLLREQREEALLAVLPRPLREGENFSFFDINREGFLKLPNSESDFSQTNRAINRSSDHRLLYHGIWRQAVVGIDESTPLFIQGGDSYGDHFELEGSLTIRFNENEDRVVLDTNLWLTEFVESQNIAPSLQTTEDPSEELDEKSQWSLPETAPALLSSPRQLLESRSQLDNSDYDIEKIYTMVQSRAMRSTEFHYLDHPAMGIVVLVEPYEIPEINQSVDEEFLPPID